MSGWHNDKHWSDRFMPVIKAILGRHLFTESPAEEDARRNTDLVTLRMDPIRVAVRIRRPEFAQYADEFTIRCQRPYDQKSELRKILEGWGDCFFYGISAPNETDLHCWALCDLRVFRDWWHQNIVRSQPFVMPGIVHENVDGSSTFRVFRFCDLPPAFVIACRRPGENA